MVIPLFPHLACPVSGLFAGSEGRAAWLIHGTGTWLLHGTGTWLRRPPRHADAAVRALVSCHVR